MLDTLPGFSVGFFNSFRQSSQSLDRLGFCTFGPVRRSKGNKKSSVSLDQLVALERYFAGGGIGITFFLDPYAHALDVCGGTAVNHRSFSSF